MEKQPWEELAERLCRLIPEEGHETAPGALRDELERCEPTDIAMAMSQMEAEQAIAVFDALDEPRAAEVLRQLDPDLSKAVAERQAPDRLDRLLDRIPTRAAGVVAAGVPADQAESMASRQELLNPEVARELEVRIPYAEGTAGRLMTGVFVRLRPEMSAREAVEAVRRTDPEADIPDDLYVVDEPRAKDGTGERLVGALSVRDLMMAPPDRRIGELMTTEVVTIAADAPVESAAMLVSAHEFLALPVLDAGGSLAGVIPAEDLMRLAVARMNRRYAQAVGTDAERIRQLSPFQEARLRAPWLLATMVIELGSGLVIHHFDEILKRVILLASFMPVISAISGNVGLQAAAITVRALDTGQVTNRWRAVEKEMLTTLVMAAMLGAALGGVGFVWARDPVFALVVAVALTCAMLTAGFMGTVIPVLSKHFGFDPATTAGPFETAFQDVIGFAVFLWLASTLFNWLG